MYGEKVMPVSRSILIHMNRDLDYPIESMRVVGNGLDLTQWKNSAPRRKTKSPRIAVIGRLSGPKGEVAVQLLTYVFPQLVEALPGLTIHVIGGMNNASILQEAVSRSPIKEKIVVRGHLNDLKSVYREFDLVIGSGRVAIEALASGCSVMAIGESNYIGVVGENNLDEAINTNFGDTGIKKDPDFGNIVHDLKQVLGTSKQLKPLRKNWGREVVENHFNIVSKAEQILECYAEARALKIGISEIPVLMYHRVTDGAPAGTMHGIYVTADEFDRQLSFLKEKGFTALTFRDIQSIIKGTMPIPNKPVILTFDDGYEDNFLNAFPLFKKHAMTGVIFLIGNPKIKTNEWDTVSGEPPASLMNDKQIIAMRDYGIEFGSHTLNHRHLTHCTPEMALKEIEGSKKLLEKRVGIPIISFAYPYGALNEQHKKMVQEAGYSFGIATDSGRRNFWADLYKIRRIPIFPGTSKFQFWKKTSGRYHWYKSVY